MKKFLLISSCMFFSLNVYAAGDVTAVDVGASEVANESAVQTEMGKLQQERDAAFVKQLEAEALIEEQRYATIEAEAQANTGISVAP